MSAASIQAAVEAREDREKRIAQWVREGVHDLERYESVVLWGVFVDAGNDGPARLPVAIFLTEEKAEAFITTCEYMEAIALPVLADLLVRDNFEVPR